MGFQDLPPDWQLRPVSDPHVMADVVDLFVLDRCRRAGTLYVLMCDGEDRLRTPVAIDDVPPDRPEDCAVLLWPFLEVARERQGHGLLIGLGRTGTPHLTQLDREWADAAAKACAGVDVRLLGLYVATPEGVLRATGETVG
jgi:hypothetical protein